MKEVERIKTTIKKALPRFLLNFLRDVKHWEDIRYGSFISGLLEKQDAMEEGEIAEYQKRFLKEIIGYAKTHTKYYGKVLTNINLDNFSSTPFLTKEIIRRNLNDMVSDEAHKLEVNSYNTGGSTGEPLEFYRSYLSGVVDTAHQKFQLKMMGYSRGENIFGVGGATILERLVKINKFWQEIDYGTGYHYHNASALYLNSGTVKYYVDFLNNLKPSIIRGYPSAVHEIARFINDGGISLTFQAKGIQLTSEKVHQHQVESIRKAFASDVYLQYGLTEVCVFAFSKPNVSSYLCSPFYGYVEVVDQNGNHVKEGEQGEIIATGFHNKAMPFIRYRTGDLAVYGGKRKGATILKSFEGREQDIIFTKDKERVLLTAAIFGQHFHSFKHIIKWQISQSEFGKISFSIIPSGEFSKGDEDEIRSKFKIFNIEVEIRIVEELEKTRLGKVKFLVQNIKSML